MSSNSATTASVPDAPPSYHCRYCGAPLRISAPPIEPLPPPPAQCQYCHAPMFATTTPAGEDCYECSNRACQWVAMAAIYAKPTED